MAKKDNPNLIFRREWWDNLRHKSPELFKEALSILFSTYFDGKEFDPYSFDELGSNPTPAEDLAAPMVKAALSDRDSYITKCERNSANIRKRYETAKSNTTEYDRVQSNTTEYDGVRTKGNIIEGNVMEGNIKEDNKEDMSTNVLLSTDVDEQDKKQPPFVYDFIVSQWNDIAYKLHLPSVILKLLSTKRKQKIKARTKELESAGLTWQDIFERIPKMPPFYLGQENGKNWSINFDWIIENPDNWRKIIEKTNCQYGTQQQIDYSKLDRAVAAGFNSVKDQ